MSQKTCAIVTGNSSSGAACIKEILEKYQDKNIKIRAVFRTQEKAEPIKNKYPGIETVVGVDASKTDSLHKAFKGVDCAMIVTVHDYSRGFEKDCELTLNLVNSAVECGVKYIVLVASFTALHYDKVPIIAGRFKPVEEKLAQIGKEKGIKWTVLRGGCFMDNLEKSLGQIKAGGETLNFPKVNLPFVDTIDIGRSAAACLATQNIDEHHGKYYSMNGPVFYTGEDVAKCISGVANKEITYKETPKEVYHKHMPEGVAQLFDHFGASGKKAVPFTDDVKRLTGQNAYLKDFIQRALKN